MKKIFYLSALSAAMLSSCKLPKFAGYSSSKETVTEEKVRTVTREIDPAVLKANYIFQRELIENIKIDNYTLSQIDKDAPVIITSYSSYPFNHKIATDTISNKKIYPVDNVILSSINTQLQKQLISSGYKVLESNAIYNLTLDENFDEYNQLVVFNIKDFGMYFQRLNENELNRVGKASVEFRLLNKAGVLRNIADKEFTITDKVSQTEMASINESGIKLGYISNPGNIDLNIMDLPSTGSKDFMIINPKAKITKTETIVENVDKTIDVVNGIKITLPKNTKYYTFQVLDFDTYYSISRNGALIKVPSSALLPFSPATLKLKSNGQVDVTNASGVVKPSFYAQVSAQELERFFKNTDKIVILFKGMRICVLKRSESGELLTD